MTMIVGGENVVIVEVTVKVVKVVLVVVSSQTEMLSEVEAQDRIRRE